MEIILKVWQSLSPLYQWVTLATITTLLGFIGRSIGVWEYFSKKKIGKKVKSSALTRLKLTENKIHDFNKSLKNLICQPYGPEHQKSNFPDWRQPKWTEIFALDKLQIDLEQAKKDLDLLTTSGSPENELSKWRAIFSKQHELIKIITRIEGQVSSAYKKLDDYNSINMRVGSRFGFRASQITILGQTGVSELEESTRKLIEYNDSILAKYENINLQSKKCRSMWIRGIIAQYYGGVAR